MRGIASLLIFWQAHPFLRLLIPLVFGIVVADIGDGSLPLAEELCLFLLVLLLCVLPVLVVKSCSYKLRHLFGFWVVLFFFLTGLTLGCREWHRVKIEWPIEAKVYEARLIDFPQEKNRSYLCPVRLTSNFHHGMRNASAAELLLYLPKDSAVMSLQPGDVVCFYGKINAPENLKRSAAFDYARYLYHHEVSGVLYTSNWNLKSRNAGGWKEKALKVRRRMLDLYESSGLSGDERAVLSALTLGYKDDLSEDVRRVYSVSGASHVLALSGLHVGILCLVVTTLLSMLFQSKHLMWLRQLLILAVVWAYVIVAGMPVSAVRAAMMCSLFVLGSSFVRIGFSLNTLAVTAFFMLLYNPFYLFDVGFQMSFAAVASILLLQPMLYHWLPRIQNPFLRYLWSVTTLSVAAQVGVFPLILYYFSYFSFYFWLTNLFVVPIAYIVVCLTLPFIIVSLLSWETALSFLEMLLSGFIRLMNRGVTLVSQLPGASFEKWTPSLLSVILLYITITTAVWWIKYRERSAFIVMLTSVAIISMLELYERIV